MIRDMEKQSSYQTALQYLWPLQSHCDAVEKDEGQDHVVKELMGDNGLAEQSEPDEREAKGVEGRGRWVRVKREDMRRMYDLFKNCP